MATISPRLSGVLLRAKMARKCPDGTSMTRPVGTSAICPGASLTSCDAARSKPGRFFGAVRIGRGTVESSRLILSRIRAAYRDRAAAAARRQRIGAVGSAAHAAARSRDPHRQAAERHHAIPSAITASPSKRVIAATRGEGRLDRRSRRSARARAHARAHGVQRHDALQAGRAGQPISNRSASRSARTSTRIRATTKRSTCSTCRPIAPARSTAASRRSAISPAA